MSFSKARYSAAVSAIRGGGDAFHSRVVGQVGKDHGSVDGAGAAEVIDEVLGLLKRDADGGKNHGEGLIVAQNSGLAGYLGGGQQLAAQIEHNQMDLVIFLRDPPNPKQHEPDVNNVVKLCDMYNIPLATNLATAELLIKALDRGDMEWRELYN